nr:MAG TPA: hypothetical protein [Caudoviricetes sp.]
MCMIFWTLPQQIIGFIGYLIFRKGLKHKQNGVFIIEVPNKYGSISLGNFIFVSNANNETTIKHEYGHTRQSYMLGWFYLLVIGIPSIIWAGCFERYRKKHNISYYAFYTERWADRLGGVKR